MNANHFILNGPLTEVGKGVGTLLAGQEPGPRQFVFAIMPWALRGLLLIPVLQIVGVAATLRGLRRWQQDPNSHPSGARKWGLHILLPLVPNLLVSLPLLGLLWNGILGVMLLFMPDVSWIALLCGSFALAWMFVRTGLVLRTLRNPSSSRTNGGELGGGWPKKGVARL